MKTERKAYLDNIRWITVLLVTIYHVGYLFNGVGVLGGIPDAKHLAAWDGFLYIVYPWFMVLLFLVSGMCARYALEGKTSKEFLRDRRDRLLVPSTLGLFVVHWTTGLMNIDLAGATNLMPKPLLYPIAVLSGVGPLWFIQLLFVYSLLLVLLRKMDRKDRVWQLGERANGIVICLLFLVIWGAAQILNAPVITTYRFGIYFAAYLLGYYVFSHESVQHTVGKMAVPMGILWVIGAAAYTAHYYGSNYISDECLKSLWTNLYLWVAVLAALGCGYRFLNRENHVTRYLSRASFGVYILHYPVMLAIGCLTQRVLNLPVGLCYGLTALAIPISLGLYELVRRIPCIRYLVLGVRKQKQ